MRYKQLLEKRKNPELNPRTDVLKELFFIEEKNSNDDLFVSFTDIKKIGINPQNKFNTPTGIYCYPLKYVCDKINERGTILDVPFASERPYVWVIRAKGNRLCVDSYRNGKEDERKLVEFSTRNNLKCNVLMDRTDIYSVKILFECVYRVAQCVIETLKNKNGNIQATMTSIMYKILGYDYCSDNGNGVIHGNEKTQCVIYNPNAYDVIKLLFNKSETEDLATIPLDNNRSIKIPTGGTPKLKSIRVPYGTLDIQSDSHYADNYTGFLHLRYSNTCTIESEFTFKIDVVKRMLYVNGKSIGYDVNSPYLYNSYLQTQKVSSIKDLIIKIFKDISKFIKLRVANKESYDDYIFDE